MLTEWTRQRYGTVTALFLSLATYEWSFISGYYILIPNCRLITIFLYMVAELSALQQIISALTGLDGLPAVIVECAVTTIYTCMFVTILSLSC